MVNNMADLAGIAELRRQCEEYDLAGREILDRFSLEELAAKYNGAGPDSWIPEARYALTTGMALFKPVVLIHDIQFAQSDGSDAGFQQAVNDWIVNTGKILRAEFPLFTWRMLSRSYRLNMAYWTSVKYMADAAISGPAAKRAWIAAYNNKQGAKNE